MVSCQAFPQPYLAPSAYLAAGPLGEGYEILSSAVFVSLKETLGRRVAAVHLTAPSHPVFAGNLSGSCAESAGITHSQLGPSALRSETFVPPFPWLSPPLHPTLAMATQSCFLFDVDKFTWG